jgi:hypothetical protein
MLVLNWVSLYIGRIPSCKDRIEQNNDYIRANGTPSVITLPAQSSIYTHIFSIHSKLPLKGLAKHLPNHLITVNKQPTNCKSQSVLVQKAMASITHLVHVNSSHQSIAALLVSQSVM